MPNFLHRTTKVYGTSVSYADLAEPLANYIEAPDLSAVAGEPTKYWIITGDVITLMSQAEQDAVDAAELVASRDALADEIDRNESYTRAFALVVLDEINTLRAAHGLNDRTPAQLKTALRNKMDI